MVTGLEKLAARAVAEAGGAHPCLILGHDWGMVGGKNAACELGVDDCQCSVPVHQCSFCGDYDYGDNDEAREIREQCRRFDPAYAPD